MCISNSNSTRVSSSKESEKATTYTRPIRLGVFGGGGRGKLCVTVLCECRSVLSLSPRGSAPPRAPRDAEASTTSPVAPRRRAAAPRPAHSTSPAHAAAPPSALHSIHPKETGEGARVDEPCVRTQRNATRGTKTRFTTMMMRSVGRISKQLTNLIRIQLLSASHRQPRIHLRDPCSR